MFDNLHDGPVTCVVRVDEQHFGKQCPKKEGARRQLPRPRHHRAEASLPIDQVRFSGTVRHTYGAWGAMGELQMKSKLTKLAAAGVLSLCTAVPALAGSVTQPGETVGLNAGTPLAPGWYAINTVDWGCMEHHPAAHMCGSHHSGCRLVNAVDDFGRESTAVSYTHLTLPTICSV